MSKNILVSMIFFWLISLTAQSQEPEFTARDLKIKEALKMTNEQYNSFMTGMRSYVKRLGILLKDNGLTQKQKQAAISQLEMERTAFFNSRLTAEQKNEYRKITTAESAVRDSRHRDIRKIHKDRLKQKGIKVS